jgi:glycosyltransferase involved in cell wall biosynthesis
MSNINPLITVIIAAYNSPVTLRCAIHSVLNQDFINFELLVIGDCCNSEIESVVYEFKDERIQWFNLPENSGSQYGPNNEGIKRGRGKYIAYLGHDDLWFSNHLSSLVNFIEETDSDLVHCLCACIRPNGSNGLYGPPANGRNYTNSFVPPSAWLHKRVISNECGFWNKPESLSVGVDQDYLNRIALSGKKINFYNNLIVLKFISGDWGLYSKKDNFPQISYLKKLEKDPQKIIEEILFKYTADYCLTIGERKSISRSVINLLGNILYFLNFNYLNYRYKWPMNQIYIYHFQRARKKARKSRGLED